MSESSPGLSRRQLIEKTGAALAAGFTIVRPESVRGSQANSKITVGLIGVGGRGQYDATIFNADPRARVTALCDLFDDRIEIGTQKIKIEKPAVYKDYEKLLAANDLDAVIIATPPFEHPRMLAAAIEARKHVYCEKPMGVDLEGVKKIIAAGRKADPKKNVSVGFQQRYGPVYLEAYKRIRAGQIGELVNARGLLDRRRPLQARALRRSEDRASAQLVLLPGLFGRLHRGAGLPQFRRAALVPGRAAHSRRRHGRHQGAHVDGDPGPPHAVVRIPQRHPRELRSEPDQPAGILARRRGVHRARKA